MKLVFNPTTGNLDYVASSAADVGITLPLSASLGGTGIANGASASLTLPNLAITLGGGGAAQTYTLPAVGGTFALLNAANVFTAIQKINVNSATAFVVEQDGVYDDQLVVDTTNGRTIVGTATTPFGYFHVQKDQNAETAFIVKNATSDTAGKAGFSIRVNANQRIEASMFSTGFTSSGLNIPSSGQLVCTGAGGFSIGAGDAAGVLKLFAGGIGGANIRLWIEASGLTGIGNVFNAGIPPLVQLHVRAATTTTNAVLEVARVEARVSTASTGGANGFGVGQSFYAETATDGTNQQQGLISTSWIDATNASRKAKMSLSAYDTAARLGIEIEASGTAVKIGLFGGTTAVQQVLNAYTSDGEGAAYTGIDNAQAGTVYATVADLNQLRVAYETLRASYDDLRTKLQTSTLVA